jgi:hypothetical protein
MLSPVLPMLLKNVLRPLPSAKHEPIPSFIDVIIMDAPPLEETTDTLALAACADASLLVIKAGKEQAKMVQKAQETLTRLKAPVLGVVVNYQTVKHQSYFYVNRYRSLSNLTEPNGEKELPMPPPKHTTISSMAPSPQMVANNTTPSPQTVINNTTSSPQTTTINMAPPIEPDNSSTPGEKPLGPTLPTITPTPGSLGLGQFLGNSHAKKDASAYKGKK